MKKIVGKASSSSFYLLSLLALGTLLYLGVQKVKAWTEPSANPPNGNVEAPINTSAIKQTKKGALWVNDGFTAEDPALFVRYGNFLVNGNVQSKGIVQSVKDYVFNAQDGYIDWGQAGKGTLHFRMLGTKGNYTTAGSDVMTIRNGDVGIGTNLPKTRLHIANQVVEGSGTINVEIAGQVKDYGSPKWDFDVGMYVFGAGKDFIGVASLVEQDGVTRGGVAQYVDGWAAGAVGIAKKRDGNAAVIGGLEGDMKKDPWYDNEFGYLGYQDTDGKRWGVVSGGDMNVVGDIYTSGTFRRTSDIRFKKNIKPLADSLNKIENLNPVSFEWKSEEYPNKRFKEGEQKGLIAQEVEEVLPEIVATGEDGYKSVSYEQLIPVLIDAMKELKKDNDELRRVVCDQNSNLDMCGE